MNDQQKAELIEFLKDAICKRDVVSFNARRPIVETESDSDWNDYKRTGEMFIEIKLMDNDPGNRDPSQGSA